MDDTNSARSKLWIPNDAMYLLLREGCIIEFNAKKASREKVDLWGCDLRGLDLRGLDADGLDCSTVIFASPICAVSIFAKRGFKAPALMPRKFQAPTSPLN